MRTAIFRRKRLWIGGALAGVVALGGGLWHMQRPAPSLSPDERAAHYRTPLDPPGRGMAVFHLGHSLVGPNMPGFVQQLAEAAGLEGARYNSQLGWGTSLQTHWQTADPRSEMAEMNTHPGFAPAREALESGQFDALVMTEMVDLNDAIRWFDSGQYAARWAALARAHVPGMRVYLYETWHDIDIAEGWLARLDADLDALWEGTILAEAMTQPDVGTIHVIPVGQALATLVRSLESGNGLNGMKTRHTLFAQGEDGARDTIHLNDKGMYLVALVHLATLYHIDPRGLPRQLQRADGSDAEAPSPDLARLMQDIAWETVRALPSTGVVPDTAYRGG